MLLYTLSLARQLSRRKWRNKGGFPWPRSILALSYTLVQVSAPCTHALCLGRVEQERKRERAPPCHKAPLAAGNLAHVLDGGGGMGYDGGLMDKTKGRWSRGGL